MYLPIKQDKMILKKIIILGKELFQMNFFNTVVIDDLESNTSHKYISYAPDKSTYIYHHLYSSSLYGTFLFWWMNGRQIWHNNYGSISTYMQYPYHINLRTPNLLHLQNSEN